MVQGRHIWPVWFNALFFIQYSFYECFFVYFIGLTFGGAWGLMEGLSGHSPNFKLRLNTILNCVTRRGPFIGNSCGILGKLNKVNEFYFFTSII